jgi:hypothetical protein
VDTVRAQELEHADAAELAPQAAVGREEDVMSMVARS